jgi:hypothetical protein
MTFTDTVEFSDTQFKEVTLNGTDFKEMRVSWIHLRIRSPLMDQPI